MTSGFRHALLAGSIALLGAAVVGLRTANAHSDADFATDEEAGELVAR
jgi:hypothetical protein